MRPPSPLIVVFPVILVVPPLSSQLKIVLVPPRVSFPLSILIKLVSTEEVMLPPRLRVPLVGVSIIRLEALQAMLRLTVSVTGVGGLAPIPILPLSVMSLPPRTKAPAAGSNVRPFNVMPDRSLLFASRVLPAKVTIVGKLGAAFQLPEVLQLLFAPAPFQTAVEST